MKAQAINIDFVVGMGLFMLTIVFGIAFAYTGNLGSSDVGQVRQKALLVHNDLEDQVKLTGRKSPLKLRGPVNVSNVPVDRNYSFKKEAFPGSAAMEVPSQVNISSERVTTIVDGGNNTKHLSYYFSDNSNLSYSNQIDMGEWMNATAANVQVKPGSPGITSLRVNDQELLKPDASLNGNDYSIAEKELYAETLKGDLKLYNGSKELVLENPDSVTFELKNLTTLYWRPSNSTSDLVGTGEFESGDVKGFTVASDYGVTFIGEEMNATVSKPSTGKVKAEIDASRLRIFLHDSSYEKGRDRIRYFEDGRIFFGAESKLEGASREELQNLESLEEDQFEDQLNIGDFEYNISYGNLNRGAGIPFQNVVVSDRPGVILGRYGNYSRIESKVSLWR